MAQNDTHVALIMLTTQMWGGGGIIGGKNFFGPKYVFLRLRRQHPFIHKTKGPTRNPISPTPPPPSAGVHVTPPAPRRAIFRSPRGSKHLVRATARPKLDPLWSCPSRPRDCYSSKRGGGRGEGGGGGLRVAYKGPGQAPGDCTHTHTDHASISQSSVQPLCKSVWQVHIRRRCHIGRWIGHRRR